MVQPVMTVALGSMPNSLPLEYPFKTGQGLEVSERLGNLLRSYSAPRVRIRGAPGIGQEFTQPIGGMSWQPFQIDGTNVDDWIECLSNRRTVARCAFGDSLEHGHGHRSETNYFLPPR